MDKQDKVYTRDEVVAEKITSRELGLIIKAEFPIVANQRRQHQSLVEILENNDPFRYFITQMQIKPHTLKRGLRYALGGYRETEDRKYWYEGLLLEGECEELSLEIMENHIRNLEGRVGRDDDFFRKIALIGVGKRIELENKFNSGKMNKEELEKYLLRKRRVVRGYEKLSSRLRKKSVWGEEVRCSDYGKISVGDLFYLYAQNPRCRYLKKVNSSKIVRILDRKFDLNLKEKLNTQKISTYLRRRNEIVCPIIYCDILEKPRSAYLD